MIKSSNILEGWHISKSNRTTCRECKNKILMGKRYYRDKSSDIFCADCAGKCISILLQKKENQ